MKRTPFRRKTPLRSWTPIKRRKRIPARRATPRRESRERDTERLAFVRSLQCCGPGPHLGEVAPHHKTHGRGKSQKAGDAETMPMCWGCHANFHSGSGPFKNWNKGERRLWQDRMANETRLAFDTEKGRVSDAKS